ncbi:MAG: hypothetical protein HUK20_09575 [Fibrobacter sp.]|nr:hypothetical protein [Fibrobacter sp.]
MTLFSCGEINSSWEVKGGGYFKYSVNGGGSHTIELGKNDCEPPFYVNNSHHYFYFKTQMSESDQGDQFSLMVNNPSTNGKLKPVAKASIDGHYQIITWMRHQNSTESPLIEDSSYIHFDEIIRDSLWTANVELDFMDCRSGKCHDSLPPIHVSGRLRYWVPADER